MKCFDFKDKSLTFRKFFLIILTVNICFITVFAILFSALRSNTKKQQKQFSDTMIYSAINRTSAVISDLEILGDTVAKNVSVFSSDNGVFKNNIEFYLKNNTFIYDIIYKAENSIFSAERLINDDVVQVIGLENELRCQTVTLNTKSYTVFIHTVYDTVTYEQTGSVYLVCETNALKNALCDDICSYTLCCKEETVLSRNSEAGKNYISKDSFSLPYSLNLVCAVYPEQLDTNNNIFALVCAVIVVLIIIILNTVIVLSYMRSKDFIADVNDRLFEILSSKKSDFNLRISKERDSDALIKNVSALKEHSDNLTQQIEEYKKLINEQELLQNKTKYFALKNQINPHFLYNTLACITGIALQKKEKKIVEISNGMAKILKYNLANENMATVAQEISMIESYLYIQQIRYNDLFSYSVWVEDSIKEHKIIRFFLQPIVENAVIHGFSNHRYTGKVSIEAYSEENHIIFKITDTGIGIPPNILITIKRRLEQKNIPHSINSAGIGLTNINSRIMLLYGDEYGLTINSAVNKGTVITVKLPLNGEK